MVFPCLALGIEATFFTGTLERFHLEPFRVGMDWLPVYMMPWNHSVQVNQVVENIVVEHCPFYIVLSRISPCFNSKRT